MQRVSCVKGVLWMQSQELAMTCGTFASFGTVSEYFIKAPGSFLLLRLLFALLTQQQYNLKLYEDNITFDFLNHRASYSG